MKTLKTTKGRVWFDFTTGQIWHDWGDFHWDGIKTLWQETLKLPVIKNAD